MYDLRSEWDLLVLGATPTQGQLCREAQDWAASRGLMVRAKAEQISPVISLPTIFNDYFASLSRKRRKNLSRAKRICKERGVTIRIYTEPGEIGPAIDTLINLHLLRWKSVKQSGTLGKPGFREFLKCLSRQQGMAGCFRVYVMEDYGAPIAAMLNFHYGSSALQFQNGFDPGCELAPHSPGSLLILHAIEQAIREGLTCYDFLRGAEDYKFQFANAMKSTTTLLLGRTLKAKAYLLLKDVKSAIKRIRGLVFQPATTTAEEEVLPASPRNPFGATSTRINTGENRAGGGGLAC
jgi:CelD/BcsL family acetyltransferase involved in cellulose biosynthesis